MAKAVLRTIETVILALGDNDKREGRRILMRITGRRAQHVTNWLATGNLPQWSWLIVSKALARRGYRVSPALFRLSAVQIKKAS